MQNGVAEPTASSDLTQWTCLKLCTRLSNHAKLNNKLLS